jgi:hypothetical protein
MSDHFDLLDFQAPDPSMAALDITGLYVFAAPHDRSRTVLILAVNPFALGPIFDPDASYRFDIDADGDLTSDLAYNVQFTGTEPGRQLARVTRALGGDARSRAALGNVLFDSAETSAWESVSVAESMGYRFFAGPRSDPFFADADGLFNGYQFTGVDSFSDKDVFAIALEVPNDDLGPGPVAVWGSTISRADGRSAQVDRTGGSNLMNFLTYGTPDEIKPYREADPSADLRRFGPRYTRILVGLGYTAAGEDGRRGPPSGRPSLRPPDARHLPERTRAVRRPRGPRCLAHDPGPDHNGWRRAARRLCHCVPAPRSATPPDALMTVRLTDGDLYARGAATLLAAWEASARRSKGAVVVRTPGVAAAVFPREPARGF